MLPLIIKATDATPSINFNPDNRVFEIAGESRPENVSKFYEPIMSWIESYKVELSQTTTNKETTLTLKLNFTYFNSTSAKFVMAIINRFELIKELGYNVQIEWFFEKPDLDMKTTGEEFSKLFTVPFHFNEI